MWPTLMVVAVLVLAAQGAHGEDRALLVGVGTYARTTPFGNLNGIDRDLDIMREVARELGFTDAQIRVLADEEATYDGIRNAFQSWLIDAVGPGERALFYFSGHGYQVEDRNGDEPDGRDEVLVAHDYAGSLRTLTKVVVDDDMATWIDRLRTNDVLVFLDACHSGSAVRSTAAGASAWSPPVWTMFDGDKLQGLTKGRDSGGSGYVALSAAHDWEQAQATPNGSTFTIGIGRAIRETAASATALTMKVISDVAAAEIARAHPTRVFHPVLSGDVDRAGDELRRRQGRPPGGSLWERLVAATTGASRRVDVSGMRSAYSPGDRMTVEVLMPVDGYLSVVTVVEGADDATVLFPNPWTTRRTHLTQGERVGIPDGGYDLVMELEDPARSGDERNLLVVVVSDVPLELERRGVEAMVPLPEGVYRTGVPYVVRR